MKITPEIANVVRNMRNTPTASERLMQAKLRASNIAAIYQYPVIFKDSYFVADFYLPKQGVIIEIDGEYHLSEEQQKKDRQKDIAYQTHGFHVVRIFNKDVDTFPTKSLSQYKKIKCPKEHIEKSVTQKKKRIRKEHKTSKANKWR